MAPIFTYTFHSKTTSTEKAHIIVHEWTPEILREEELQDTEYFRRAFGKIDTVNFFMPMSRLDIKTRGEIKSLKI
jgi:hypothetical protein